jgi:hypothetical protein
MSLIDLAFSMSIHYQRHEEQIPPTKPAITSAMCLNGRPDTPYQKSKAHNLLEGNKMKLANLPNNHTTFPNVQSWTWALVWLNARFHNGK